MPRVDIDLKLDFKDVLFRPKRSSLKSRSEVSAINYLYFDNVIQILQLQFNHLSDFSGGVQSVYCLLTTDICMYVYGVDARWASHLGTFLPHLLH